MADESSTPPPLPDPATPPPLPSAVPPPLAPVAPPSPPPVTPPALTGSTSPSTFGCVIAAVAVLILLAAFAGLAFLFFRASSKASVRPPAGTAPSSPAPGKTGTDRPVAEWTVSRIENFVITAPVSLREKPSTYGLVKSSIGRGDGYAIAGVVSEDAKIIDSSKFNTLYIHQLAKDLGEGKPSLEVSKTGTMAGLTGSRMTAKLEGEKRFSEVECITVPRGGKLYSLFFVYDSTRPDLADLGPQIFAKAQIEPQTGPAPTPTKEAAEHSGATAAKTLPPGWAFYDVGGFHVAAPFPMHERQGGEVAAGSKDGLTIIVARLSDAGTTNDDNAEEYLKGLLRGKPAEKLYDDEYPGAKPLGEPDIRGIKFQLNSGGPKYPGAELKAALEYEGSTVTLRELMVKIGRTIYMIDISLISKSEFPPSVIDDIIRNTDPIVAPGPLPTGPVTLPGRPSPLIRDWKTFTAKNLEVLSPIPLMDYSDNADRTFLRSANPKRLISVTVAPLKGRTPRSFARQTLDIIKEHVKIYKTEGHAASFAGYPGVRLVAHGTFHERPVTIYLGASADQENLYQVMVQLDDDLENAEEIATLILSHAKVVDSAAPAASKPATAPTPPDAALPPGWRVYEAGRLTFTAPAGLKTETEDGFPQYVGEIGGLGMFCKVGPVPEKERNEAERERFCETTMRTIANAFKFRIYKIDTQTVDFAGGPAAVSLALLESKKGKEMHILHMFDRDGVSYGLGFNFPAESKAARAMMERISDSVHYHRSAGTAAPAASTPPRKSWPEYKIGDMAVRSPILLMEDLRKPTGGDTEAFVGKDTDWGVSLYASVTDMNRPSSKLGEFTRGNIENSIKDQGTVLQGKTEPCTVSGWPAFYTQVQYQPKSGPPRGVHSLDFFVNSVLHNVILFTSDDTSEHGANFARAIIDTVTVSTSPPSAGKDSSVAQSSSEKFPRVSEWPASRVGPLVITAPVVLRGDDDSKGKFISAAGKGYSVIGKISAAPNSGSLADFNEFALSRTFNRDGDTVRNMRHVPITINGLQGDRMVAKVVSGENECMIDFVTLKDGHKVYQVFVAYNGERADLATMAQTIVEKIRIER